MNSSQPPADRPPAVADGHRTLAVLLSLLVLAGAIFFAFFNFVIWGLACDENCTPAELEAVRTAWERNVDYLLAAGIVVAAGLSVRYAVKAEYSRYWASLTAVGGLLAAWLFIMHSMLWFE